MRESAEKIARWLTRRVEAAGARGLVVGLSGGVDSAVVARLCQMAAPEHTLAVLLPCHSMPQDEADAKLVADHFHIPTITVRLDKTYDAIVAAAQPAVRAVTSAAPPGNTPDDYARPRIALANVKPRLRMASLYFVANHLNYLLAGTGNRSELVVGYFTKYGDGGVDLLPLGNLVKSEVRAMARKLGVPASIIDKAPSAGLWSGQTDEGEMGFSYGDLEAYLEGGPQAVAPAVALKIERLSRQSDHKRMLPPVPDDY